MPKYHFEIVDGFRLEDPVGLECANDAQARDVAKNIAHQIAVDIAGHSARDVVVLDDNGDEVCKAKIKV
jgi:hypothetical protein